MINNIITSLFIQIRKTLIFSINVAIGWRLSFEMSGGILWNCSKEDGWVIEHNRCHNAFRNIFEFYLEDKYFWRRQIEGENLYSRT